VPSLPACDPSRRLQQAWLSRGLIAWLLAPLALVMWAAVRARQALFRVGALASHRLPVPVIVVGNLIAGGAGKTPAVIAVVTLLRERGYAPGVISRGYGRHADAVQEVHPDTPVLQSGDEPLLLRLRCGVPVVVGRDRVAAGRHLLALHPAVNVIVSDDGLQHLRLVRDVQVVVFDERGVGNGWLLPAGPLREPMSATPPPRSAVVYNAPCASTPWPGACVRRSLAGVVELRDWWAGRPASPDALAALKQASVTAAAGMARPERFFDMLRHAGLRVLPLPLPDHHDFSTLPWPADTSDVIVTEKDAVKLDPDRAASTRVWVAPLNFALGDATDAALLAWLPSPESPRTPHGNPIA
jgi:tetraacyldisaccharide 4'-kinase